MSLTRFPLPPNLTGGGNTGFWPFQLTMPASMAFSSGLAETASTGFTAVMRAIVLRWEVTSTTSPSRTRPNHSESWVLRSPTDTWAVTTSAMVRRENATLLAGCHGAALGDDPAPGRQRQRYKGCFDQLVISHTSRRAPPSSIGLAVLATEGLPGLSRRRSALMPELPPLSFTFSAGPSSRSQGWPLRERCSLRRRAPARG
ncbi:MAG: hypothetical protein ACK55I_27655 [bacterium]